MNNHDSTHEQLLDRWHEIGSSDRRKIVEALPVERRQQLQTLLNEAADAEAAAGKQYLVYSAWLAPLVEACDKGEVNSAAPSAALKEPVRKAIREAHLKIAPESLSSGFSRNVVERLRQSVTDWMARL